MKRIIVMLLVMCTLLTQLDVSMFAMEKDYIEKTDDAEVVLATSITLNEETVRIGTDEWIKLIATVLPENCTEEVVWTSSDEGVVTVCEGLFAWEGTVHSLEEGTATITATVGDLSASCVVVVSDEVVIPEEPDDPVDPEEPDDPVDPDVPDDPEYTGLYFREDGSAVYYVEGQIARDYYGLVQYEEDWYYVEQGVLNWNYTGLTCYYGTWYYVENGILNWNYTGLTCYYDTWYYVENGVLNWNYTGLTCYYDTWYYVENGILNWNYTGLTYYYGTWYYVENGILNWGHTGLTYYYGTWYYVENGILNWNYTGLTCYYDTWYYVESGVLNWNYTGLTCYYDAWYYVENGQLNFDFYGLVLYEGSMWYVEAGCLNFGYNGLMTNVSGTWAVNNGQVNTGLNGLLQWSDGWYYFQNGRLVEGNHLVQNEAGWWYVQDGKIDFTTHTVAQNEYGWWYVEDGKINFDYNGQAQNDYGWWMIKNGQVDFSFTGEYKDYDKLYGYEGTWIFENGKRVYNMPKNSELYAFRREYAYRHNDVSVLYPSEVEDFYELKACLDYIYQFDTLYEQELAYYEYLMEYGYFSMSGDVLTIIGIEEARIRDTLSGKALTTIVCLEGEWYVLEEIYAYRYDSYNGFNVSLDAVKEWWPDIELVCDYEVKGKRFNYYRMQDGYVTNIGEYYIYLQEHIPNLKEGETITMVMEWKEPHKDYDAKKYIMSSLVPGGVGQLNKVFDIDGITYVVYTWQKFNILR